MTEEWRGVVGVEDIYQVSDMGRIRRIGAGRGARPGHTLSPTKGGTNGKYLKVILGRLWGRYYVHRMVAQAFHGDPPSSAHEVNHLNGDTHDNRACNLQWVTRSENNIHSYRVLGRKAVVPIGEDQWNSKLTEREVLKMRDLWATGKYTQLELGNMFCVLQSTVSRVVLRQSWKHI